MLCYIVRTTSFVLHRVLRKTCLIAMARHTSFLQFDLIIELTRKLYITDDRSSKIYAVRQDDIIETVPTRLETAYLDLSSSATCSNISEDSLTLSTPMYRRNLDIYRTMCIYISVPDSLARCKLWGPATAIPASALIIPCKTCRYLSRTNVPFSTCPYLRRKT